MPYPIFLPGLLLALISISGCRLTGDLIAAAAGAATGAATANPAVGIAVGVGVQAWMDATVSYIVRKRQQAEQDAIATEVATTPMAAQCKLIHVLGAGTERPRSPPEPLSDELTE
jgi:hypothetical protein